MIKEIHGDLIKLAQEGEIDVLCHGCNCFNTFGAGIAYTIKQIFPGAYEEDLKTVKGDKTKLGTITYTDPTNPLIICNCYTQHGFSGRFEGIRDTDYDAVRSCMKLVKQTFSGKRIGLPLIGAGLGGGSWDVIKQIIIDELKDEDVTIVHFTLDTLPK